MKYVSLDTEATGLDEKAHLIQVAVVPVDVAGRRVLEDLGRETLVWCPTFEELKPDLNPWVLEHNESLIRSANQTGIRPEKLAQWFEAYFSQPEIKNFFGKDRPPILGKSLSALDIPLLTKLLGRNTMDRFFHHHTVDITCVARYLVDNGVLPAGCQSTTKLLQHLKIREEAKHTALSDAVDMGNAYVKLIGLGLKLQ